MKYIDAEKLKAEIERRIEASRQKIAEYEKAGDSISASIEGLEVAPLISLHSYIGSLQQEQLPGIEENGIPGKDFIPVEWVDACEKYGKWEIVKQEQPEVDLEKEIFDAEEKYGDINEMGGYRIILFDDEFRNILRHFFELGRLNTRKEETE